MECTNWRPMRRHMCITSTDVRASLSVKRCTFALIVRRACVVSVCPKKKSRNSPADIALTRWQRTTRQTRTISACAISNAPSAFKFWQSLCWISARKWCTTSTASFVSGTPISSTIKPRTSITCSPRYSFTKVYTSRVRSSTPSPASSKSLNSILTKQWRYSKTRCVSSEIAKKVSLSEKRHRTKANLPKMISLHKKPKRKNRESWKRTYQHLKNYTKRCSRRKPWSRMQRALFLTVKWALQESSSLISELHQKVWAHSIYRLQRDK